MDFSDLSALSPEDYARAKKAARGHYQVNVLDGDEALSGSTLRGRAAKYRGRYQASAQNYLGRVRALGLIVREEKRAGGRRVLVVASPEIVAARVLLSAAGG